MKKSLFNSLGSNYSGRFTLQSAFGGGSAADRQQLKKVLGEHYGGSVTLTYKGREALELALKISGLPPGSAVGINGFTCYVVYRAVENAGYTPVFIDIAPSQMHFGLKELQAAHKQSKKLAAVIIQNTLGYPADLKSLRPYCDKHKIMIIEDAAHSLGAVYETGQEVGTAGSLSMFSFSQDKPLDVVAGGALVDHRKGAKTRPPAALAPVSWWQREINRDYPFWTGLIRGSYSAGIGRVLHFVLKRVHGLATPMGDAGPGFHAMSPKTARLLLLRWANRAAEVEHRRTIAGIYRKQIPKALQLVAGVKGEPSYLRFPLKTGNRASLIAYLKKYRIYVGDTWYDAPLAPKRYLPQTTYERGMCPHADELVEHIVNLPTHINISPEQAEYIAGKVKAWHASR